MILKVNLTEIGDVELREDNSLMCIIPNQFVESRIIGVSGMIVTLKPILVWSVK